MIVIGITGSIGMGKSFVCKLMPKNSVILNLDLISHQFLNHKDILKEFPEAILDKKIDRKKLGLIVFNDESKLKILESIIYPKLKILLKKEINYYKLHKPSSLIIIEAPLLFESGMDEFCDYTINVTAPYSVQKKRVMARNKIDLKQFRKILKRQIPSNKKSFLSNYVIYSGIGKFNVKKQIEEILKDIYEKYSKRNNS